MSPQPDHETPVVGEGDSTNRSKGNRDDDLIMKHLLWGRGSVRTDLRTMESTNWNTCCGGGGKYKQISGQGRQQTGRPVVGESVNTDRSV